MTAGEVYDALLTAAAVHGLPVSPHPDLCGASVTGVKVQAYIYPAANGYTVDLWKGATADALQISGIKDLPSAITVAVDSALDTKPSRGAHIRPQ